MGFNIQLKLDIICLLNVFMFYNFEELWAGQTMPDQAQLICYSHTKSQFHTSIHSWDKRLEGILASHQSKHLGQYLKTKFFRHEIWDGKKSITITLLPDYFYSKIKCKTPYIWSLWTNGLVVKTLDSQSSGPVFKTTGWLQGRLSLSSFRSR